jgi:HPt (histidine-containing phosphotransfer) domain-containing protein
MYSVPLPELVLAQIVKRLPQIIHLFERQKVPPLRRTHEFMYHSASDCPWERNISKRLAIISAVCYGYRNLCGVPYTEHRHTSRAQRLPEVIEAYLADTPVQLANATKAIALQDHVVLGRAAHSLKSTSQSVGAILLARAAEALEKHALGRGSFSESERLLAAARVGWEAVAPELRVVIAVQSEGAEGRVQQAS